LIRARPVLRRARDRNHPVKRMAEPPLHRHSLAPAGLAR
jgi:hypothetical protein